MPCCCLAEVFSLFGSTLSEFSFDADAVAAIAAGSDSVAVDLRLDAAFWSDSCFLTLRLRVDAFGIVSVLIAIPTRSAGIMTIRHTLACTFTKCQIARFHTRFERFDLFAKRGKLLQAELLTADNTVCPEEVEYV